MTAPDAFYRISVKALVLNDEGKFLLAQNERGFWALLGGGLDHGETPHEGLAREIREETCLTAAHIMAQPSYFYTVHNDREGYWKANVVYRVELANLDFTSTPECRDLRFFTTDEALDGKVFRGAQKFAKILEKERYAE